MKKLPFFLFLSLAFAYTGIRAQQASLYRNKSGQNRGYAWSQVIYEGVRYDAFCLEYYDYIPSSGDLYSIHPSSTALTNEQEEMIKAILDASDDASLGKKKARFTYIAYAIWYVTDGLDPSWHSYTYYVNLILGRVNDGTYRSKGDIAFLTNLNSSNRQNLVAVNLEAEEESNPCEAGVPDLNQYTLIDGGSYVAGSTVTVCENNDYVILDLEGNVSWDVTYKRLSDGSEFNGGNGGVNGDQLKITELIDGNANEGVWEVTYTNDEGCSNTESFTVNIQSPPSITPYVQLNGQGWTNANKLMITPGDRFDIGTQTELQDGLTLTMPNGTSKGRADGDSYFSFSDASAEEEGTYTLVYTDANGCTNIQSYTIEMDADRDGDGVGDGSDQDDDNDGILDTDECPETLELVFLEEFNSLPKTDLVPDGTCNDVAGAHPEDAGTYILTDLANSPLSGAWHNPSGNDDGIAPTGTSLPSGNFLIINAFGNSGNWCRQISDDDNRNGVGGEMASFDFSNIDSGTYVLTAFFAELTNTNPHISSYYFVISNSSTQEEIGRIAANNLEKGDRNWQYNEGSFSINSSTDLTLTLLQTQNEDVGADIAIDNLALYKVICPDTDKDGLVDYLDTDSDGDGCPDAIEGSGNYQFDDLDTSHRLTTGVDEKGIPGGSPQEMGTSLDAKSISEECDPCNRMSSLYVDTDGDEVGDGCDIDDDNDGIIDWDEGCFTVINSGEEISEFPTGYYTIWYYEGYEAISGSSFGGSSGTGGAGTKVFKGTSYIGVNRDTIFYESHGSAANNRWSMSETPTSPTLPDNYIGDSWTSSGNPFYQIEFRRKFLNAGTLIFGGNPEDALDDVIEVKINGIRVYAFWPSSGGNAPDARPGPSKEALINISSGDEVEIIFVNLGGIGGLTFTFITPNEPSIENPDTDNDGVSDCLDLDSDGDQYYDKLEAGVPGATTNGSVTDSLAASTPEEVGANGLANDIESDDTQFASTSSFYSILQTVEGVNDFQSTGIQSRAFAGSLPIDLSNFVVIPDDKGFVYIIWQTATESNNDFFTVERSRDAKTWEVATEIKGQGDSDEKKEYEVVDNQPFPGTSYYRLKQTDFDGKFTYFSILETYVEPGTVPLTRIFPNPTQGPLTLEGSPDEVESVGFFDLQGKEVSTKVKLVEQSTYQSVFDLSELPDGVYILETPNQSFKIRKE